jgi:hypothetical protein
MVSCEINDSTYIVDSARADCYIRGSEPRLVLSQLEDFKGGTVNNKLTLHFPAKDLLCIVCTNNILVQTEVAIP